MFSDIQLANCKHYIDHTPKHMLGIDPARAQGAYDAVGGARPHGFRRGINMRQFSFGGV